MAGNVKRTTASQLTRTRDYVPSALRKQAAGDGQLSRDGTVVEFLANKTPDEVFAIFDVNNDDVLDMCVGFVAPRTTGWLVGD